MGLAWGAGALLALAVGLVIVAGEWYRGATALSQPPARPELAGGTSGLRTLIWTDEGGVSTGDAVRVWILCENQTGGEVTNLRFLTFETPGFDKVPPCWRGIEPVCSPGGGKTGLQQRLADKGTSVVYASLRPQHLFGRHGASGILTWKDGQGHDFHRAVILPGLELHSDLWDLVAAFVKAAEICALPVVLAFLGWKLKRWDEERAERAKTDRERREEEARAEREWQIHLQETWSLQLPKAVDNISTYYMPAANAISKLLRLSRKLEATSREEDLLHCLFALLRVIRCMTGAPGGITFKNYGGEKLATRCWAAFDAKLRAGLKTTTDEEATRVEDVVHAEMSLAQFVELAHGSPETGLSANRRKRVAETLGGMIDALRSWVDQPHFKEDTVPLEVLLQILLYEMNRPLELWYGYLPEFPSEEFADAVSRLPAADVNLREKLLDYQRDCEKEAEISLGRWTKSRQARGDASVGT